MDSMQQPQTEQSGGPVEEGLHANMPPQPPAVSDQEMQIFQLQRQHKSGANWFYWIAGLSLVNSVLWLTGQEWTFIIGLGATQLVDGITIGLLEETNAGEWIKYAAMGIDILIAGIYVLFGFLANKGFKAGFIVGMVLYALDGLIFLMVQDFLSIGFHVFALFWIFGGLKALSQLKRIRLPETMAPQGQAVPPPPMR